jgi:hypothetical protein
MSASTRPSPSPVLSAALDRVAAYLDDLACRGSDEPADLRLLFSITPAELNAYLQTWSDSTSDVRGAAIRALRCSTSAELETALSKLPAWARTVVARAYVRPELAYMLLRRLTAAERAAGRELERVLPHTECDWVSALTQLNDHVLVG